MSRTRAQGRDVDSEGSGCLGPALLDFDLENDSGICGHGQPGILPNFKIELASAPACIAEYQQAIIGSAGVRNRFEYIAGGCEPQLTPDLEGRLPVTKAPVQYQPDFIMDRPANVDGLMTNTPRLRFG